MSTKLTAMHDALLAVLNEHEAVVQRVRGEMNAGLTTEAGAKDAVAKAAERGQWLQRVGQVETSVADWLDRATSDVSKARTAIMTPQPGTATDQLLAETRAVRAWDRLRRTLDAADEPTALFKGLAAVKSASGDDLRVIVEELGPYLEDRGVDRVPQQIDDALADSNADYGRAKAYLTAAQQTSAWLQAAAATIRDHVMSIVPGASNAAALDLFVRNIGDHLQTAEGAGARTEANGRWDSALQEFQR